MKKSILMLTGMTLLTGTTLLTTVAFPMVIVMRLFTELSITHLMTTIIIHIGVSTSTYLQVTTTIEMVLVGQR